MIKNDKNSGTENFAIKGFKDDGRENRKNKNTK